MAAVTEARPGTKAKVRNLRMSASKVRVVLNLVRGKSVNEAIEILSFSERLAAQSVLKCLRSAVANAAHNEDIPGDELYVSACFADEGPTLKRFRPRARGRAGPIHKQTCHMTIEVSRFNDEEIDELRSRSELKSESKAKSKAAGGDRAKRVAKSKAAAAVATTEVADEVFEEEVAVDEVAVEETEFAQDVSDEVADHEDVEVSETPAAEEEE